MAAWIQHKCATINVYVLEQVLELVVDNFHRRVPRWTDLGTFIRLLALELSSPSVPNVSESQVSLLHLSSQPPLGGVLWRSASPWRLGHGFRFLKHIDRLAPFADFTDHRWRAKPAA